MENEEETLTLHLSDLNGSAEGTLQRAYKRHLKECDNPFCFICAHIRNNEKV